MSTHHGYIKEFPWIRVDAFDGDPAKVNPYTGAPAFVHLLTHAHTDHIGGLDSPNFQGKIYTTAVTKLLLLKTMEAGERVRHEELPHAKPVLKFANLVKERKGGGRSAMSLVREISLDTPQLVEGPHNSSALVTAIDANHCPGSCMFLIEGVVDGLTRAVLVTGDIRAEDWWLASLKRNPALSKFLVWDGPPVASCSKDFKGKSRAREQWQPPPSLDHIYLDTSCVLVDEELVTKEEAVHSLVQHIAEYPPTARFFINAWTWGYEDLLKGIYRAFGEPIHLDKYKHKIYSHGSNSCPNSTPFDPLLAALGTKSTSRPLRFHACERRWKCDQVWGDGVGCYEWAEEHLPHLEGPKKLKRPGRRGVGVDRSEAAEEEDIIYINPAEMPRWKWEQYNARLEETLELARAREEREGNDGGGNSATSVDVAARRPNFLIVPLARHSTLPELQRFVSLFKPRTLYPLVIIDDRRQPCRDYLTLPELFASCLAPGGPEQLKQEALEYCRALVDSRRGARPRGTQLDSSAAEVPDHLAPFVNPRVDHAVRNVEGGAEVVELVEVWSRMERHQATPSLSPQQAWLPKKLEMPPPAPKEAALPPQDDLGAVVPLPVKPVEGVRRPQASLQQSPFVPLPDDIRRRLLSYGDESQEDPPSGSMGPPTSKLSTSTPLLPSPAIQLRPPLAILNERPRKRQKAPLHVLGVDSTSASPDPSPLDPAPTKATTHVDPTASSVHPPSVSTLMTAPPPAQPLLASSAPASRPRPLLRPSRETADARRRVLAILRRKMGKSQPAPGPLTPEQLSFRTVSASVATSGGSGKGVGGQ